MFVKIKKIIETKTCSEFYRTTNIIAAIILGAMFIMMLGSVAGDALTNDEAAHIPAGYSYLTELDYRLNPEHPPLIKDLAAIPLLFINPKFPNYDPHWTDGINEEWYLGDKFLYKIGNDADKIIFWARFPIMLLALLFGFFIFRWTSKLYGNPAGLIALFLYSLSPNIIAHSRFVTTDLGIAFFFTLSIYFFWKFLEKPSWKNLIISGVILGLAHLTKFSSPLILPSLLVMGLLAVFKTNTIRDKQNKQIPIAAQYDSLDYHTIKKSSIGNNSNDGQAAPLYQNIQMKFPLLSYFKNEYLRRFYLFAVSFLIINLISFSVIDAYYATHLVKMPLEVQKKSIKAGIGDERFSCSKELIFERSLSPVSQPFAWYVSQHYKSNPGATSYEGLKDSLSPEINKDRFVCTREFIYLMQDNSIFRPFAYYFFGFMMVFAHSSSGHSTFFWGENGNNWWNYYGVAYLIKEPIPSQILLMIAFLAVVYLNRINRKLKVFNRNKTKNTTCALHKNPPISPFNKGGLRGIFRVELFQLYNLSRKLKMSQIFNRGLNFLTKHYLEIGILVFIAVLLFTGSKSRLQLGVRHILPMFPLLYILIAGQLVKFFSFLNNSYKKYFVSIVGILFAWLAIENVLIFPSYLSYYNEYIGGPKNGYKYFVDSNTDWGQDLRRLAKFVNENKISKIKLDYFGKADPKYYLGDKVEYWGVDKGPTTGWFAVGASPLQWNRGIPADKKIKPDELNYHWLNKYTPVAQIGYSIFVYYISE